MQLRPVLLPDLVHVVRKQLVVQLLRLVRDGRRLPLEQRHLEQLLPPERHRRLRLFVSEVRNLRNLLSLGLPDLRVLILVRLLR